MKNLFLMVIMLIAVNSNAQVTGSFTVGGDINRFYPVTFSDGGWASNYASELELGRSSVHLNTQWRGALIAKFTYHLTRWGNGGAFINADISQQRNNGGGTNNTDFIAGWWDATGNNGDDKMILWLKGGSTTYYYKSKFATTITVYDGTANPLPFQEVGGSAHTYKTTVDPTVNSFGPTFTGGAYFLGTGNSFFNGSVGIGTSSPSEKLSVKGKIRAQEIKVELANWPDFVFAKDYKLLSLSQTEKHIQDKGHLPGIPSAAEVEANGIELGEMNKKLLQKIEELTLYLIELKKDNDRQNKEIEDLKGQK